MLFALGYVRIPLILPGWGWVKKQHSVRDLLLGLGVKAKERTGPLEPAENRTATGTVLA